MKAAIRSGKACGHRQRISLWACCALALAAAQLGSLHGGAQILSVNFDSTGDMTDFVQRNSSDGSLKNTTTGLTYVSGAGTGGSGGMQYAASSGLTQVSAIDTATTFAFSQGTGYTLSLDYHMASNALNPFLTLGFVSATTKALGAPGTDSIGAQILGGSPNAGSVNLKTYNGTASSGVGATFTSVANTTINTASTDWYQMSVTLTLTDAASSLFTYTTSIYDIGSDGAGTPALVLSQTVTLTNAGIASDSALYAAFYFNPNDTSAVDNLSVAAVPEPKSIACLLLAAAPPLLRPLARRRLA